MRNYRQVLEQRKGQRLQVDNQLVTKTLELLALQETKLDLEQAQAIIILVSQATQEELRYHVSELVTLALASVFDDPYELDVSFEQRRNQTECDITFVRNGEKINPLTASGGGAVDVAAFALRVSLWSLQNPHTRPIMILDEPFQHVKGDEANIKCIQMVKAVSERLGLQILMVSDERVPLSEIEAGADKVFKIGIKGGVSYIM
jgi:hypothetical protein